jgi:AsmA protein
MEDAMRRIIRISAIVVVAFVAVVVALVMVIPASVYRGPIEQAGAAATGRALHLRGPLGFTLYPEIGISVSDVTLDNVPGSRDPEMATVGRLIVGVRLLPLLSKRVEITRLVLEKPVIHVEVAKDGTGNWVFAAAKPQAAEQGAGTTANFSLSNLRIQNGTLSYFDARTGKSQELDDVDIGIDTTSLEEPFAVAGAATYKGHRLELAAKLADLGAALKQTETPASLSISSDTIKMNLDGAVGGKTTAAGKLHLETPSLRQFASWMDVPLPAGKGLGALTLDATVAVEPGTFSASDMKLALDGMNLAGDLRLMTGGSKPAIGGKLSVDRLDLNPYMTAETGTSNATSATPARAEADSSDTPISFDILKAINADLALSVGRLLVRNLEVQKAQITVMLQDGVLNSNLENIILYEGAGKGTLVVDASRDTPTIKNSLNVSGVKIEPFLVSFLGVNRIVGTGNVSFDVAAQGASPKAIIGSLSGKGAVTLRDGMIKGVDLAAVARTVQSALTGASLGERASTDFAELGGTFTISKGVMNNTDFHLLNPFIRITGNGVVDLANRSLDFHLEPKLVASIQGQGGQGGLAGVAVPFRVTGPWTKLSYAPDMQNVGKVLTGKLLETLSGDKKGDQSGIPKPAVGDVLKGLFGK